MGDGALDDWRWLIGPEIRLWHVTKAGDALLQHSRDGSIYFLDVISGTVERVADSPQAFESAVVSTANASRWLMTDVVDGQAALGMIPGMNACLSFKQPPVLGGQLSPDNFEISDVQVHLSIAGQIHQQVKDLPPGTKIGSIKLKQTSQSKRPWWRFW